MSDEVFPASICHQCAHHRYVKTARSTFIRCAKLPNKYPPQPVLRCPEFRQVTEAERSATDDDSPDQE